MDTGTTTDPVHGAEASRWGGWSWRDPRRGDHFRTCSYCGSINPEDLAAELVPQGACATCGGQGVQGHYLNYCAPAVRQGVEDGTLSRDDLSDDERRRLDVPDHPYDTGGPYPSWTYRKYGWPHKFYVEGLRPREPEMLHCLGHYLGSGDPGPGEWTEARELTPEQRQVIDAGGMGPAHDDYAGWYQFSPKKSLFAKFYAIHLSDPAVAPGVKAKIEDASGIRFHFRDGRVAWHPAGEACCGGCPSPEVTGGADGDQQVGGT